MEDSSPAGRLPVLYTQNGCSESCQARAWLTERCITFTERNATGDIDVAKALLTTGTFATPLLMIGNRTVLGFRPDTLATALADVDQSSTGRAD